MRKVYTIGETVYDIIFKDSQPIAAKPGGAMLNTAVSLGRLKTPVRFISEYGKDSIGLIIDEFLKNNGVNVDFINRFDVGKTPLAIAVLDENNNADYTFYKLYPDERLNIDFPEIKKDDIVLFGSFYAITKEVMPEIVDFIRKAKDNDAVIIYDPNFRKPHLNELEHVRGFIEKNISLSDIVRASDEDMSLIFGAENISESYNVIKKYGCNNLIYTRSCEGVFLKTSSVEKYYPVPKINPVSTIGAGDTFNAGLIFSLLKNGVGHADIDSIKGQWDDIVSTAIAFGTEACMSYDNYISEEFAGIYN